MTDSDSSCCVKTRLFVLGFALSLLMGMAFTNASKKPVVSAFDCEGVARGKNADGSNVTDAQVEDWRALCELFHAADGPNWTNRTGWRFSVMRPVCEYGAWHSLWYGVSECNTYRDPDVQYGTVKQLHMINNNLGGTLPSFVRRMRFLKDIRIMQNLRLSGTIPGEEWLNAKRTTLTHIDIAGSPLLTGELPVAWANITTLLHVGVSSCSGLTGTLPSEWYRLTAVTELIVAENTGLTGGLPSSWSSLGNIRLLALYGNSRVSGALPPSFGALNAQLLSLNNCSFSGKVPFSWASMTRLFGIRLDGNNLEGFEHQYYADDATSAGLLFPRLEFVTFSGNRMTGPLPIALLCSQRPRQHVDLSFNAFSGSIPSCLANTSGSTGALSMNFAHNRIDSVHFGVLVNASAIVRLNIAHNRIQWSRIEGAPDGLHYEPFVFGVGSITELDLSGNPLATLVQNLRYLDIGIPRLTALLASDCMLHPRANAPEQWPHNGLADFLYSPAARIGSTLSLLTTSLDTVDLSSNARLGGSLDHWDEYGGWLLAAPLLQSFSVSHTPTKALSQLFPAVLSLDISYTQISDCLPDGVLQFPDLASLDLRGVSLSTRDSAQCASSVSANLQPHFEEQVQFIGFNRLACPQWVLKSSGGRVEADAEFLNYRFCRCTDAHFWAKETCVPCVTHLLCDPYTDRPQHCVVGNRYPASSSTSRLELSAASLVADDVVFLRCRLHDVCNVQAQTHDDQLRNCGALWNSSHHANWVTESGSDQSIPFECATGHDRDSLMCSRCDSDYWAFGRRCRRCVLALAIVAAIVLPILAVLVVAVLFYTTSTSRLMQIALFWIQLTGVLQSSRQFSAQSNSAKGTAFAESAHAVFSWLQEAAIFRPSILSCLHSVFTYELMSSAIMCMFVALFAGIVLLRNGRGTLLRLRVLFARLLVAVSLPAATHALGSIVCLRLRDDEVSVTSGYLNAAPWIQCGTLQQRWLAWGLGAPTLVLFFCAWCLTKRRTSTTPGSPGCKAICMQFCDRRLMPQGQQGQVVEERKKEKEQEREQQDASDSFPLLQGAGPSADYGALSGGDEVRSHDQLSCDDQLQTGCGPDFATQLLTDPLRKASLAWWIPVVDVGRRFALAAIVSLQPPHSPYIPVQIVVVLMISFALHMHFQPWHEWEDNVAEAFVLAPAIMTYMLYVGASSRDSTGTPNDEVVIYLTVVLDIITFIVLCTFGCLKARSGYPNVKSWCSAKCSKGGWCGRACRTAKHWCLPCCDADQPGDAREHDQAHNSDSAESHALVTAGVESDDGMRSAAATVD